LIEIVAYPTIGYKLDVDPRFNNFGFKWWVNLYDV
jgi:hypothetical protein